VRREQHGLLVPLAERRELPDLAQELGRHALEGDLAVDPGRRRGETLAVEDRVRARADGLAQGVDLRRLDLAAGGLLVPAVADHVRGAAVHRVEDAEARDRARAPAAGRSRETDDEGRAREALGEARGDDADETLVPALAGEDEDRMA